MTTFKHYPQKPDALSPEYLQAEFDGIVDALPSADAATDPASWLDAIARRRALRAYVDARESFRHHCHVSPAAAGIVIGFGAGGYVVALEGLARIC